MIEEEFKTIKLELDHVSEDGTWSAKIIPIRVNKLKPTEVYRKGNRFTFAHTYSMEFALTLPKYIVDTLRGKTLPVGLDSRSVGGNEMKSYPKDMGYTISSNSIDALTQRYVVILSDYSTLKTLDKLELREVIFYAFKTSERKISSDWDSKEFGESTDLNFKYSKGYISNRNGKEYRFNVNKMMLDSISHKEFYAYKYVDYTVDREVFFENILQAFKSIIGKLKAFEGSLSEETINSLMQGSFKLLH